MTSDGFVRFAEAAWHLIDWILQDASVPQAAKDEARLWKRKKPIPELCICQDIANENKHMVISLYTPATADASAEQGWGAGRFGKGGYGIGEQSITVTMADGTSYNALHVVGAVTKLWEGFFVRHAL